LLLGKIENEPPLPYEKAITDYLHELGKLVKERVSHYWKELNFYTQVFIILTVSKFNIYELALQFDY
jgi:hypothetical protein